MQEDRHVEGILTVCCSATMIPVGFFIAAVFSVIITRETGILEVDAFTAALYVFGLQVLFLVVFTITYALRSGEGAHKRGGGE